MRPIHALTVAALAAAALAPFSADAVDYAPSGTVGWYQVQDATTYVELCTASSASCDIPAGTRVRVIDFGTSPASRTVDTVPGGGFTGTGPATESTIRDARTTYTRGETAGRAYCPAGTDAIMSSCAARGLGERPVPVWHEITANDEEEFAICDTGGIATSLLFVQVLCR